MNKKLSGILGIILSIIILVYFEPFIYKILGLLNININNYSSIVQTIINILIKLSMCFVVYLLFKKDFRRNREMGNIFKNLLLFIVYLFVIVGILYLFKYVVNFIADIFDVKVININYTNIFKETFNFNLIVKIIIDYLIIPFLYCSIIMLSIDKLCRNDATFIILTGFLASIIHALTLSGTLGFVIVNSLSTFLLFSIFAYIYKRENSIYFVISLYSLFLISNVVINNYLGW